MSRGGDPFVRNALLAALLLSAAVGWAVHAWVYRSPLVAAVVGLSLTAFALYGVDKAAARRRRRRVPEVVLHALALLGGSPGALLGQWLFRHKTRKSTFQLATWAIVLVQGTAVGWHLAVGG